MTTTQPKPTRQDSSIYDDTSTIQEDFNVCDSQNGVRSVCDPETGAELLRFHLTEESVS